MSPDASPTECSRAGCRQVASQKVNWRNPRIHSADRVKVWLACGEHVEFLRDYLASRGFPVLVTGIDEGVDLVPENAP
ncbi:MAG: hypothetical protein KF680_02995 [Cryobacterium sp.]|nr:hypothetical protein [Cryobacterium sp.]